MNKSHQEQAPYTYQLAPYTYQLETCNYQLAPYTYQLYTPVIINNYSTLYDIVRATRILLCMI